jgi:putative membrane protein
MNETPETVPAPARGDGPIMTFFKGVLVGIANIIPGVSGGTFALILGIFDRLVGALNAIGPGTVRVALRLVAGGFAAERRREFAAEWRRIDAWFLIALLAGAGVSILSSSFLIDWLLTAHWSPTLAFFIGLILPSVAVPWAMMDRRGPVLLWAVPGMALTVGVSLMMPEGGAGSDNLALAAGTGALAISAMILPGISGSFLMLVMGQYQNVLAKLTGLQRGLAEGRFDLDAFLWLGALGLGMFVGLLAFARLLGFLLKRFKAATMAFLIGLLLGSLWVLWPFKDISAGAEVVGREGEVKQEVRIATAPNRLPESMEEGLIGGGAFLAGLAGSAGLIALGRRRGEGKTPA